MNTELTIRSLARVAGLETRGLTTGHPGPCDSNSPDRLHGQSFSRRSGDDPAEFPAPMLRAAIGRLAGLAHHRFHRHGWYDENVYYLQDHFALPDKGETDVGRKLINGVHAVADAAGGADVHWLIRPFKGMARHLPHRIRAAAPVIEYGRP